jgi:predicted Fe-S protein YdhL (DUF1289 family)
MLRYLSTVGRIRKLRIRCRPLSDPYPTNSAPVTRPMSSKNPCISICKFSDDTCIACGRTKPECKAWKKMDKDERRDVNEQAVQRLKDMKGTAKRKKKKA